MGDYLEAKVGRHGVITLIPRTPLDRHLDEGLADLRAGRIYGPFDNAAEMAASVEANLKKLRAAKKTRRGR